MDWSVVEEKAIRDDGTLYFAERLSRDFLEATRRTMGSYHFSNQYQNEPIPEEDKHFKKDWLRYYTKLPRDLYSFGFVDPAIGQLKHHDYTSFVVVSVDCDGNWYLRLANRYRLTPTQLVEKMFEVTDEFGLMGIGVEVVAYQQALIYLVDQEMRRRNKIIPLKGVTRNRQSKDTRILGLVPRFEWNRILVPQGLHDFEIEYATFPRGTFDDILDGLSSVEEIIFYPEKEKTDGTKPIHPNDPGYESHYIRQLERGQEGADVSAIYGEGYQYDGSEAGDGF